MTLATLTDQQRADLLKRLCRDLDLDYSTTNVIELLTTLDKVRDKAWRYDDLNY